MEIVSLPEFSAQGFGLLSGSESKSWAVVTDGEVVKTALSGEPTCNALILFGAHLDRMVKSFGMRFESTLGLSRRQPTVAEA